MNHSLSRPSGDFQSLPTVLNDSKAVIKYDSSKCGIDGLIKALEQARGVNLYEARVKKEKSK